MSDIARLAGVSTATVSRALNKSPLINEETRTRIEQLAKSLNYSINVGAQNLRLKQNRTVAVVVPFDSVTRQHLSDPFFLGILGSIADALTDRGYDMLLTRVSADELDTAAQIYDTGRAIGVILIGQWRHHDQLNQMAARRVPIVVWGAQIPQQLYLTVGSDNLAGGRLATEHLLQKGRRRIAFFGDVLLPEVADRFEGYRQALRDFQIPFDEKLVVPAVFTEEGGRNAVRTLLERKLVFDGLFACSDLLAMTAINSFREIGMTVPEDVAVVGYDDIELARYFHPALTTVRQPIAAAGEALVAAVLSLADARPSVPVLLQTELIARASS
ncbi:LacI family DNA-binding transcriptional regulator [Undibacterium sp. FT137W]|uniref:LacI family DNA-binding transcriptional regulator n=2 Tax=Undibacterium fentianense TaxID=2828728 RepID=A0A941E2E5_9BURK|nr:LacI family DNA-binding transcriptional regulator [Undibacterium fentianense]